MALGESPTGDPCLGRKEASASNPGLRVDRLHNRLTASVKRRQENGLNLLEKMARERSSKVCLQGTRALPLF